MSHLLDSNICSAHFRRPGGLSHRFIQYGGGLYIPTIVLAELYCGAFHVPNPTPLLTKIEDLAKDVILLDFNKDCAKKIGEVRGSLMKKGINIPPVDLMIASVALVYDLTLVTHNTMDFCNVPSLRLEDWLIT